jgi:hypothetical protein
MVGFGHFSIRDVYCNKRKVVEGLYVCTIDVMVSIKVNMYLVAFL